MRKSQLLSAVCAGVVTLLASVTANAAIVYNLDRTIGAGTVTGFIETDGTIGVLGAANITDWTLTLTAPNLSGGPTVVIDAADANSITTVTGTALTASATGLTFDFSSNGSTNWFLLWSTSSLDGYRLNQCFSGNNQECIFRDNVTPNTEAQWVDRSGQVEFAVAAVPVPAAVWLFGSGLLGLIGVARRKKA